MQVNIKATGIELTGAISDYAYKRISTIEKYLDKQGSSNAIAQVEVGKSTRHHRAGNIFRAEIHLTGTNLDAYAVSEMEDLYAAIDVVKDEIVHNVLQLKGRRETLARRSAGLMKNAIKGLSDSTVRGFSWGMERLKFKSLRKRK